MKSKSSLPIRRYTKKELYEITHVWSADKPNVRNELINNYLALQKIADIQQRQIDAMKQRWEKTGKMLQGVFQRHSV